MSKNSSLRKAEIQRRHLHKRRRALTTALGAGILIFALIGVLFVIITAGGTGLGYIKAYLGPSETAGFFESYISPVVAGDPAPFTDISTVDSEWLLKTAVWSTYKDNEDTGRYAYSDDNRIIVPISDVLVSFKKLFGDNLKPDYHIFTFNGLTFEFNQNTNSFYIPDNKDSLAAQYLPHVIKISRQSGKVYLTVQYKALGKIAKTMIYTLTGSKGDYAITQVKVYTKTTTSSSSSSLSSSSATSSST